MPQSLDLFAAQRPDQIPLAERCRPQILDDIFGHDSFLGKSSPLRRQIDSGKIPSLIFWGPPGVGKTTLAHVIAKESGAPFEKLSAVTSGKKELKSVIDQARALGNQTILFIDEIHRYNKAQQDGLLHAVEDGTITLIGATTENPSFEVIAPLLSRCQVIQLKPLAPAILKKIIANAIETDKILGELQIEIPDIDALLVYGSGDARRTLNLLESCLNSMEQTTDGKYIISSEIIKQVARQNILLYDKQGDYHYDTISAFIKSVRGSDPDAALHYLARMIESGEDPVFICRRLIILASEDIGNAEPYALSLATAGLHAVQAIGMPEARIILGQVTTYLAACPKSNAAYLAIDEALHDVREKNPGEIPLHLRNAPTQLMRELKYGSDYKYPHDYPNHFIIENYLPKHLKNKVYYRPSELGREKSLKDRLSQFWGKHKKYKS
jgi:putative ATPase